MYREHEMMLRAWRRSMEEKFLKCLTHVFKNKYSHVEVGKVINISNSGISRSRSISINGEKLMSFESLIHFFWFSFRAHLVYIHNCFLVFFMFYKLVHVLLSNFVLIQLT